MGNVLCPVIIRLVGLGLASVTWGLCGMLTGWATGHFGLFGVWRETVKQPVLNWLGLFLTVLSLLVYAQAKDDAAAAENTSARVVHHSKQGASDVESIVECEHRRQASSSATAPAESPLSSPLVDSVERRCSPRVGRTGAPTGFGLALLAGLLFGSNFDAPTVLEQLGPGHGHSKNSLDYVFSHFCGILATSGFILMAYLVLPGKKVVRRQIILPGVLSGLVWGVADTAWFKANEELGFVIAYPIVCTVPPLLAMFWGMVLFGELRSRRNRLIVAAGACLQVPGVIAIALSKA
eukprot:gnl/TRDRNA2_/TRDRNA2_89651_c0_seq2.p1 gnl/TRDRNA2_/TRDRNA2_89651_c0~~gnl/TRDRNA2_/TRDRNA2_89651_c0_seq2.p1  ORF type:complete len:319 (-),score=33.09 gnl/TRDRNA2_/TRDRNA2_89651_c0_seq2:33-911(-)